MRLLATLTLIAVILFSGLWFLDSYVREKYETDTTVLDLTGAEIKEIEASITFQRTLAILLAVVSTGSIYWIYRRPEKENGFELQGET